MQEFRDALAAVRYNPAVRVVVLTSAVDRVFCAGADLKERAQMQPTEVSAFVDSLRSSFSQLQTLPMPTIAVIEGAALGGGLEMALACDFRIAGGKALLGLPEVGLAIIPGAGGTQRLPRVVGVPKAKELIFTGQKVSAAEAEAIGLVTKATEAGEAYAAALALAARILPNGPVAVRMAKAAVEQGSNVSLDAAFGIEAACYAQIVPTEDRLEGLLAFKEKRAPVYKGK
jgi:methylglutaconyl-CoA hydratase